MQERWRGGLYKPALAGGAHLDGQLDNQRDEAKIIDVEVTNDGYVSPPNIQSDGMGDGQLPQEEPKSNVGNGSKGSHPSREDKDVEPKETPKKL
jgi:hypothetical protein